MSDEATKGGATYERDSAMTEPTPQPVVGEGVEPAFLEALLSAERALLWYAQWYSVDKFEKWCATELAMAVHDAHKRLLRSSPARVDVFAIDADQMSREGLITEVRQLRRHLGDSGRGL